MAIDGFCPIIFENIIFVGLARDIAKNYPWGESSELQTLLIPTYAWVKGWGLTLICA